MKIIYILSLMFLFLSCNNRIDEEKFFNLYKEILIIRGQEEDTAIANPRVKELFKEYNYSEEQFKDDFFSLANKDEKFASKVDSLRRFIIKGNKEE